MRRARPPPPPNPLRQLLRDHGLRSTPTRLAVLSVLSRLRAPISHAQMADALGGEAYDRVTLFRVLNDLHDAGLVLRTDVAHIWRFELSLNAHGQHVGHPHLECVECGRVVCVAGVRLSTSRSKTKIYPLADGEFQIQLRGRCERCGPAPVGTSTVAASELSQRHTHP